MWARPTYTRMLGLSSIALVVSLALSTDRSYAQSGYSDRSEETVTTSSSESSEVTEVTGYSSERKGIRDEEDPGKPGSRGDDDYNFSWLDPDKKIYVLQNRRYTKAGKPLLSLMAGPGISGVYQKVFDVDLRVAYYFLEYLGIEIFYQIFFNSGNNTLRALEAASPTTLPLNRQIKSQAGVMLHYVPWYAKINVFNTILYFDWYFAGGVGVVSAEVDTRTAVTQPSVFVAQDRFGLFIGTGHQYHLSDHVLLRIDFTGAFYRAPIFGLSGGDEWYPNYNFGFGVGFKI